MKDMQEPADILIVDDMVENLRVLVRLLEAQGYHTRTASNGSLAQRAAKGVELRTGSGHTAHGIVSGRTLQLRGGLFQRGWAQRG